MGAETGSRAPKTGSSPICWAVPALLSFSPCLSMGGAKARRSQKFFSEQQHQAVGAVCPQQHWDWISCLWHVTGIGLIMEDLAQQCGHHQLIFLQHEAPACAGSAWMMPAGCILELLLLPFHLIPGKPVSPSKGGAYPSLQEPILHSWGALLGAGQGQCGEWSTSTGQKGR